MSAEDRLEWKRVAEATLAAMALDEKVRKSRFGGELFQNFLFFLTVVLLPFLR